MNLLQTRRGRLAAFGGLYLSQGLPQGFTAVALAMQFKREGMDEAAIASFVALSTLPWSWKWLMGPLVDNLHIKRFGARKQWIVAAQIGMLLTLVAALLRMPVFGDERAVVGFGLFVALLVVHNVFAATQDVAIDAMACATLPEKERGKASGLMFACAESGALIGGAGVLKLKLLTGSFGLATLLLPMLLFAILIAVMTLICEKSAAREMEEGELAAPDPGDEGWQAARDQVFNYLRTVGHTVFLTKRGFLGFVMAVLPPGGLCMSIVLSTLIAPVIGMTDNEVIRLTLFSGLIWAPSALAGGWLSDLLGRRPTLALFGILSVFPGLWMGWQFKQAGWDHPPGGVDGVWPREEELIRMWWIATLVFACFSGLIRGARTAFMMDIVNPKIGGTHFTALMAMSNFTVAFTTFWQGHALSTQQWNWSLWHILLVDSCLGLLFLFVMVFIQPKQIHV